MKFRVLLVFALSLVLFCDGCMKSRERLQGVWISDQTETEWGPARLRLEFRRDGRLQVSMVPPTGSSTPAEGSAEANYEVRGRHIISDAINKGKPVQFQFEGEVLVIDGESESAMRLKRQ